MKISVVIPVYGCKKVIYELYNRLTETLNKITKKYEIIFVNDDCPQNSIEEIKKICQKDSKVIGIELSRNFGQMKAILAGLDYSSGDYIVVMDCDLQDKPEEIEKLYNKILEGYDIVFAKRRNRKDNIFKIIISSIFYKLCSFITDSKYDPGVCNFSISKKIVINNYCRMREEHRAFVMYLKWLGFKQAVLDVEHNKRKTGKSSYSFKKKVKLAFDIIFSRSDKLLRIITYIGFCITFISFCTVIWIIINYWINSVSPGWSSIISTICLMSGIIISVVGVVGIYIGNIFIQVKERPLYVIKDIINNNII